ncbi:MAG: hypothetical protein K6G38_00090 [Gammaproteobacteria bacterium]|nr:hypothetical protein [Gammaproteobacteria bacterium]
MKKKIMVAFLFAFSLLLLGLCGSTTTYAESYDTYQDIEFDRGKIVSYIEYWNDEYINTHIGELENKMFGWDISYTIRKLHFNYIAETLYSVKNTGRSNIIHTFKYEESTEDVVKRKVKGSLDISYSETKKGQYKYGLEDKLEVSIERTTKTKQATTDSIKVTVAPYSELSIDIRGEGYFFQGFAKKCFFYIPIKKGAFEYVVITTEYYSINMWSLENEE